MDDAQRTAQRNRNKDRDDYDRQITSQSELLDKSILAVSTASFNVALLFVDKIKPLQQADHTGIFVLSLLSMAIAIVSTLSSFYCSMKNAEYALKRTDEFIESGSCERPEIFCPYDEILSVLNKVSLGSLIIGLFLLVLFIFCNV